MLHQHATLTAHRLDSDHHTVTGALYTADGQLIPASQRNIGRRDPWHTNDPPHTHSLNAVGKYQAQPRPTQTGADAYLEHAIFAGHLFGIWGHTITESVSTAWAAPELPDWPVVFLPWARVGIATLHTRLPVVRLAGWGDRTILLLSADCVFGEVYVPDRTVRIDECVHQAQPIDDRLNQVYDRMIGNPQPQHGPVFLARPDTHRRRHPHETQVADALGIPIIRGWEHDLHKQIAIADQATHLIGFTGSNLHHSVFAKRGTPITEIQDLRAQSTPRTIQHALCELRAQPYARIPGYRHGEPRPAAEIAHDTLTHLHA